MSIQATEKRKLMFEFFDIPHSCFRGLFERMITKFEGFNRFKDDSEKDKDIDRLILVAKSYILYDKKGYNKEIFKMLEPIFEYLLELEYWRVVDLKICCMIIKFTKNYEEASLLVNKFQDELRRFRPEQFPEKLISALYLNLIERVVHADYFEPEYSKSLELDTIFNEIFKKVYRSATAYDYKNILAFLAVLKGLFENNEEFIDKGMELAKEHSEWLCKYIEKTISIYKR